MSEIPRKKKERRERETSHEWGALDVLGFLEKQGFGLVMDLGIAERSIAAFSKSLEGVEQWEQLQSARALVARRKDEEAAACGGHEIIADAIKENLGSFGDDFGGSEASSFGYSDAKERKEAAAEAHTEVAKAQKMAKEKRSELRATKEQLKKVLMLKVVLGLLKIAFDFAKIERMGADFRRMEAKLVRLVKRANRLCLDVTSSSDDWQDVMDNLQELADSAAQRAAEAEQRSSTLWLSAISSWVSSGSTLVQAASAPKSSVVLFASAAIDAVFGTMSWVHSKKYSKLASDYMDLVEKVDECKEDLDYRYQKLRRDISRQIK